MFVDFNILNQLGSPSINSNTFANRPAAGQTGRLFVSTDTFEIYRDNGTTWDLIGGPGAGTITGTGTATQVAYFTGATAIGSSSNLYWDNTNTRLGIGTSTPGSRLDIHGTGTLQSNNSTGATNNNYLALQRAGSNIWRLGDTYNGGDNYFSILNSNLSSDAFIIYANTSEKIAASQETYSTGDSIGILARHNLTIPAGTSIGLAALGAVNSNLNVTVQGNATIGATGRQGLEGNSVLSFTGLGGTLTVTQGATVRAFSALSSVYAFSGVATGTITHLAGLRVCFPDNSGVGINITNNYAILINDQTTGTGTVTYTNRWGIYQEGASDLNYFNGNLLIKSTTNTGEALQVTGTAKITSTLTANSLVKSGGTASQILAADGTVITAGTNITIAAGQISSTGGGISGSGTTNYLPKFTAATTLGDSRFFDDGTVTFLGNGDVNATPSTGIFSGTGGTGTNIAGAELRIRGGASTGNAAGGPITFYTSAAGASGTTVRTATEAMRIASTGNVGIGTASPLSRLEVNSGTATAPTLKVYSTVTTYTANLTVGIIELGSFSAGNDIQGFRISAISENAVSSANVYATFSTRQSSVPTEQMRLTSAGSLGIGTTSIGSKLQVNGNAAIGYSASRAASTNGLAIAGNLNVGTGWTTQDAWIEVGTERTGSGNGYIDITTDTTYTDYGLRIIRGNTGANTTNVITVRGTGGIFIITEEAGAINFNTTNTNRLTIPAAGGLTFADANNIAFNTTTGTKIGTATSQKLAFWNATPIVQPTTAVAGAARVGGGGATVTDTDTFGGYTIAQVVQALRNTGILA